MENRAEKLRIAMFGQKRWSREGGIEVVVKELSSRMVKLGHQVTCYNRSGHHVSGKKFDSAKLRECKGVKIKTVPDHKQERICSGIVQLLCGACLCMGNI